MEEFSLSERGASHAFFFSNADLIWARYNL